MSISGDTNGLLFYRKVCKKMIKELLESDSFNEGQT